MTMFIEFLYSIMTLNIGWFVELFANNILLAVMVLTAFAIFYQFKMKNAIFATALIFIQIWVIDETLSMLGAVMFVGSFLLIYYICKMGVWIAADEDPKLKKHLIPINEAAWMIPLLVYNLFRMGII